jgi:hypothetical protein
LFFPHVAGAHAGYDFPIGSTLEPARFLSGTGRTMATAPREAVDINLHPMLATASGLRPWRMEPFEDEMVICCCHVIRGLLLSSHTHRQRAARKLMKA